MPSGHVRWLLEQFEFDFERVYPGDARRRQSQGEVRRAAVPRWRHSRRPTARGGGFGGRPAGRATKSPRSIARISAASRSSRRCRSSRSFAEAGGVIVAFGGSAVLGHHLGLPVSDHLVEVAQDGSERPLPGTKFYIPGVDAAAWRSTTPIPLAFGFEQEGGRVLRQQPGDGAGAGCVAARRQAGGVVRQQGAAALRLGVGPALSRGRHRRASKRRSARARCSCSDPRSPSARSRTARSSSCSTASITAPQCLQELAQRRALRRRSKTRP